MNDQEPKYFTKFKIELYDKLDGHAEQIAYVSEQVTILKSDVKRIEKKLDKTIFRLEDVEERTEKLEKKAFA